MAEPLEPSDPGWNLPDVSAMLALGEAIGRSARAGDVIALVGDLGAGKTTLTRGMAAGLGIEPRGVSSPTFVLMHEYGPGGSSPSATPHARCGLTLVHIDAYRLAAADELDALGWPADNDPARSELGEGAVIVVEWADRVAQRLPAGALWLTIEHAEKGRRVQARPGVGWDGRLPTGPEPEPG